MCTSKHSSCEVTRASHLVRVKLADGRLPPHQLQLLLALGEGHLGLFRRKPSRHLESLSRAPQGVVPVVVVLRFIFSCERSADVRASAEVSIEREYSRCRVHGTPTKTWNRTTNWVHFRVLYKALRSAGGFCRPLRSLAVAKQNARERDREVHHSRSKLPTCEMPTAPWSKKTLFWYVGREDSDVCVFGFDTASCLDA